MLFWSIGLIMLASAPPVLLIEMRNKDGSCTGDVCSISTDFSGEDKKLDGASAEGVSLPTGLLPSPPVQPSLPDLFTKEG